MNMVDDLGDDEIALARIRPHGLEWGGIEDCLFWSRREGYQSYSVCINKEVNHIQ
jgi:hypothetical protein